MINNIEGLFYSKPKFEIIYPDKANVSASDYEAKKFSFASADKVLSENAAGTQVPFIVCHPVSLQMKVTTWYGKTIEGWIFEAGKDPMPLKKIFASPAPVKVEDGVATATTVTTIQVGY